MTAESPSHDAHRLAPAPGAPRFAWGVAIACVAILAGLASVFRTADPDVYWHMRTAQTALATRSLLPTEPFSYSMAGAPWPHKDWLAEFILYLGFAAFGYVWFVLVKFAAAVAVVALLHASLPRPSRGPLVLAVLGGLVVSSFSFLEQPAVFSLVMFAGSLAIEQAAFEAAAEPRASTRALGVWVGLNFVWTWLHRFSLLGHGELLGFAGVTLASRWAARSPAGRLLLGPRASWAAVTRTAVAALAGPLIALLNPSGIHALISGSTMAAHPELREQFWEWKRVGLHELWSAFPVALVVIAVAWGWTAVRLGRALWRGEEDGPVRALHLMLAAVLAAMTVDSVRWLPYLAIVAIAIVGRLLGEAQRALAPSRRAVLVPVVGLAAIAGYAFVRRDSPYAIGEGPSFAPRGALAFAREHGLRGRVANAFDFGGYLLWTDANLRVLVDGRSELVYPPEFVVRCLLAEHDESTFDAMRAADGVDWAFAINTPGKPGFGFLAKDPRWSMVYWSDVAAIYVRRDVHPELEPLRFRFVDPRDPARSVLAATAATRRAHDPATLVAIGDEVRRMREASPKSIRAVTSAVLYDDALGPSRRAERDEALTELESLAGDQPGLEDFVAAVRSHGAGR